ncbi:MAG: histidinol-phosphate transaminase [Balneolaceae bacterium]|nr:histidinol-phosphate transaminase [Balneolaceae bacterium]
MDKTFDIKNYIRPNIRDLKPYRSARDDFDTGILLDANENSMGAPYSEAHGLNRYPSPYQKELKARIAEWRGVQEHNIFVGVGSDEAIDLLFRIFCEPGKDRIITTPPTYGMYKVSAAINDVAVNEVLMTEDLNLDVEAILENTSPQTKLIFVCSPNNPTGNVIDQKDIQKLLENFSGIIVIDEAYIDFSDTDSWASKVNDYPNLVVLQTMSKSFGLAGIRLGMAFASKEIINYMTKVKAPYNVNVLTSRYALKAFDYIDQINENISALKEERKRLRKALSGLNAISKIFPSEANFLLVRVDNAKSVYEKLASKGVIVRYRGNEPRCESCLRITVGTPEENNKLIETLQKILS